MNFIFLGDGGNDFIGFEGCPGHMDFSPGGFRIQLKLGKKFFKMRDGSIFAPGDFLDKILQVYTFKRFSPGCPVGNGKIIKSGSKKFVIQGLFKLFSVFFDIMRSLDHEFFSQKRGFGSLNSKKTRIRSEKFYFTHCCYEG